MKSSLPQTTEGANPNLQGTPAPRPSEQGPERLQSEKDPDGSELSRATVKPWETVVEAGRCSDVQIV